MPTVSSLLNWLGSQDQNLDVVNESGQSPAFTRRGQKMVITFPDADLVESTKSFFEQNAPVDGSISDPPNDPVPGSPSSSTPNRAVDKDKASESGKATDGSKLVVGKDAKPTTDKK